MEVKSKNKKAVLQSAWQKINVLSLILFFSFSNL